MDSIKSSDSPQPPQSISLPVPGTFTTDLPSPTSSTNSTPSLASSCSTALLRDDPEGHPSTTLVFSNLSTVPPTPSSKFAISSISGLASPGQILAVMGPTGSGKTTLLNTLAGRVPLSAGSIWVNGAPISRRLWRTKFGYVLQTDVFFPTLTLKQTLIYNALLRLPDSLSYKDKLSKVEDIIDILDLYSCQHTQVGDDLGCPNARGLSGGERKRLSIASELLTNPSVLLIDEPTSGLDSFTAIQLIKSLKHFAESTQKNVILSVHQPSSRMFGMFDTLLALSGGKTAYFGARAEMTTHMEGLGLPIQPNYNPADFLLEMLKYEEKVVVGGWTRTTATARATRTGSDNNNQNQGFHLTQKKLCQQLETYSSSGVSSSSSSYSKKGPHPHQTPTPTLPGSSSWSTSFLTQVKVLTRRNIQIALPRIFSSINVIQTFVLGLMAGLVWWQTPRREETLNDLEGWMFFSTNFWMLFVLFQALWSFPPERPIVTKERRAGAYRLSSFYVAKILGELPLEITLPSVYFLLSYAMIGATPASFLGLLAAQMLSSVASQSVGLFFSALFPSGPATTVAAIFTVGAQLLGGYLTKGVPSYLKIFSLVYNGLRNLEIVEYSWGSGVSCGVESKFPSCRQPGATTVDVKDLLWKGDETDFPLWAHTAVLVATIVGFRVLAYICLRRQL